MRRLGILTALAPFVTVVVVESAAARCHRPVVRGDLVDPERRV
jgi:hypothetical protein